MSRKQNVCDALSPAAATSRIGRPGGPSSGRRLLRYRGAAGLFRGRRRSMVRNADGSRSLTPDGWRRAR